MSRKNILKLLTVVRKETKKSQKRLDENKKASEQAQATSRTSWSAAGERVYAQGQVEVSKQKHNSLKKLRKELEKASNAPVPEKVIPSCYLRLESGSKKGVFMVKNIANIEGFSLISDTSPLGKVLVGKKVNDHYSLRSNKEIEIDGIIMEIG